MFGKYSSLDTKGKARGSVQHACISSVLSISGLLYQDAVLFTRSDFLRGWVKEAGKILYPRVVKQGVLISRRPLNILRI